MSPNASSPTLHMFFLSAVFMGMTLCIFILYGISANGVRAYVVNSPRAIFWLQRSFAVTFAALGVKLAMTEQ
jgi:threonine/homoserine/homoserine lactone efflux protein